MTEPIETCRKCAKLLNRTDGNDRAREAVEQIHAHHCYDGDAPIEKQTMGSEGADYFAYLHANEARLHRRAAERQADALEAQADAFKRIADVLEISRDEGWNR